MKTEIMWFFILLTFFVASIFIELKVVPSTEVDIPTRHEETIHFRRPLSSLALYGRGE